MKLRLHNHHKRMMNRKRYRKATSILRGCTVVNPKRLFDSVPLTRPSTIEVPYYLNRAVYEKLLADAANHKEAL